MVFPRTTATVFEPAKDLPIVREREIKHLLISYEDQQEETGAGRELLDQAAVLLEQRFQVHPLDDELVRLAQFIYCNLGEYQAEINVLRQFLATSLKNDARAWAWWHLVDCLALADCAEDAMNEQCAFLAWALSVFLPEECYFVIADGTQARSWLAVGMGSKWLCQCRVLFEKAPWTGHNRLDRFYCLRTAVRLALDLHAEEEAQSALGLLRDLLNEDGSWGDVWWTSIETNLLEMIFAQTRDDMPQMRVQAEDITRQLACWEQEHLRGGSGTPDEARRFRSLVHNTAAPLYRAGQYDLAIPLFERAIAYHTTPYYAYLWLAASLWQTTHDRSRVFPLLRQAAARFDSAGDPWSAFQHVPEFAGVPFGTLTEFVNAWGA